MAPSKYNIIQQNRNETKRETNNTRIRINYCDLEVLVFTTKKWCFHTVYQSLLYWWLSRDYFHLAVRMHFSGHYQMWRGKYTCRSECLDCPPGQVARFDCVYLPDWKKKVSQILRSPQTIERDRERNTFLLRLEIKIVKYWSAIS